MAAGLVGLLLLLAPEDPAQLLRVAWASQYEWKEDAVRNVTLHFRYKYAWGERGEFTREGTGQVVVVGDEVVRRHYPDLADEDARARFDEHLTWVLGRFLRRPFEEVFKDVPLSGPEPSAFDQLKIGAGPRAFFVKDGRLVAAERNLGTPEKPFVVRVDYTLADIGGGYVIAGETLAYTRPNDAVRVTRERSLTTRMESERPAPGLYSYEEKSVQARESLSIEFDAVRFDLEDPIVLDPAARDLLKAAWERRYVLPNDVRIRGQFQRSVDKDLARARWQGDVRGTFQVWGMDDIQIELEEPREEVQATCAEHIRWIFDLLRDVPFEKEFAGCGFELEAEGDETVVRAIGYPKALAFRIVDGAIAGHHDRVLSEWGWWEYKTRSASGGRVQLDRMRREVEGRKIQLDFSYQRSGGQTIPKKFGVLGLPVAWRGAVAVGVAEYSFRRTKVSFPDK